MALYQIPNVITTGDYFKKPSQIFFSNSTISQPVATQTVLIPNVITPLQKLSVATIPTDTVSQPIFAQSTPIPQVIKPLLAITITPTTGKSTLALNTSLQINPGLEASWLNRTISQPFFTPWDENWVGIPPVNVGTYFKPPLQISFTSGTISQPVGNIGMVMLGVRASNYAPSTTANSTVALFTLLETYLGYNKGNAILFDGSQNSVTFTIASAPSNTTSLTFGVWVSNRKDAINSPNSQNFFEYGYLRMYFRQGSGTGTSAGRIRFDEAAAHEANGQSVQLSSGDQSWHYYVGSYNWTGGTNSTLKFYVDGNLVQTTNSTVLPTSNYTGSTGQIGKFGSNFFTGALDHLKVYPGVPTDAQVTTMYQQQLANNFNGNADFTTPLLSYTFDDGQGSTAQDSSGNGQTGTLNGNPLPAWISGVVQKDFPLALLTNLERNVATESPWLTQTISQPFFTPFQLAIIPAVRTKGLPSNKSSTLALYTQLETYLGYNDGLAIQTDGTQNFATVNLTALHSYDAKTVSFFVKSTTNNNGSIQGWGTSQSVGSLSAMSTNLLRLELTGATASGRISTPSNSFQAGTIYHVAYVQQQLDPAGTRAVTDADIYINGVKQTKSFVATGAASGSSTQFNIGSYRSSGLAFWPGIIDKVQVFNAILSDSDVATLAKGYPISTAPTLDWEMDDGNYSTTLIDSSGNGYTGLMQGSPIPLFVDGLIQKDFPIALLTILERNVGTESPWLTRTISQPYFTPYDVNQLVWPASESTYFKAPPPPKPEPWLRSTISQPFSQKQFIPPYDVNWIVWPPSVTTYFKAPPAPQGAASWLSNTVSQPFSQKQLIPPYDVNQIVWPASEATYFKRPPAPTGVASWLNRSISQPYFTPYDVNQLVWPAAETTYYKAPPAPTGIASWLKNTISQPLFIPYPLSLFNDLFYPRYIVNAKSTVALLTLLERNVGTESPWLTQTISQPFFTTWDENGVGIPPVNVSTYFKAPPAPTGTASWLAQTISQPFFTPIALWMYVWLFPPTVVAQATKGTLALLTLLQISPTLEASWLTDTISQPFFTPWDENVVGIPPVNVSTYFKAPPAPQSFASWAKKTVSQPFFTPFPLVLLPDVRTTGLPSNKKNTLALNTTLEIAKQSGTVALSTTFETAGNKSTLALLTILEVIPQYSTVALLTNLERNVGTESPWLTQTISQPYFTPYNVNHIVWPASPATYFKTVPPPKPEPWLATTISQPYFTPYNVNHIVWPPSASTYFKRPPAPTGFASWASNSVAQPFAHKQFIPPWDENIIGVPPVNVSTYYKAPPAPNGVASWLSSTIAQPFSQKQFIPPYDVNEYVWPANEATYFKAPPAPVGFASWASSTISQPLFIPLNGGLWAVWLFESGALWPIFEYVTLALLTTLISTALFSTLALLTNLEGNVGSTVALLTNLQSPVTTDTSWLTTTISQPYFTPFDVNQKIWPASPATYFKRPPAPTGAASWLTKSISQPYFTPYNVNHIVWPPSMSTYFKRPPAPTGTAAWLQNSVAQPFAHKQLIIPLSTWIFRTDWNFIASTLIPRTKIKTLALSTTLESASQNSTVALKTTLETAGAKSTIALSTTLETAGAKGTVALKTTLETTANKLTVALLTNLSKPVVSTLALSTTLETAKQNSTVALKTVLETPAKGSTIALLTSLEGVHVSCLALLTNLQFSKNSTTALYTILEKTNQSTVALATALVYPTTTSTLALLTTLTKGGNTNIALLTLFSRWILHRPKQLDKEGAFLNISTPRGGRSRF